MVFEPVTLGVVRLVYAVIQEFGEMREPVMYGVAAAPAPAYEHYESFSEASAIPQPPPVEIPHKVQPLTDSAIAALGPEHVVVTPLQAAKGRNGNVLPTLEQIIRQLQSQAMGAVMPSMAQFDESKPANWASAAAQMQRLNLSWEQLREKANLKPRERGLAMAHSNGVHA